MTPHLVNTRLCGSLLGQMTKPFFTIGHSRRPIEEFVALLRDGDIKLVADVRRIPRSRNNPQYNKDTLPATLNAYAIEYRHIQELGGLRNARPVPRAVNAFWQNESFHNYADYAIGDEFRLGLRQLRGLGHARQCAIMCAEIVWWRCHRRIIADYLIAAGETVIHILSKGQRQLATSTEALVRCPNGTLIYPLASKIVGYHQDEEKNWVAELSCGHQQHVRHRPPFVERPWVLTEVGRAEKIGHPLVCAECARETQKVMCP